MIDVTGADLPTTLLEHSRVLYSRSQPADVLDAVVTATAALVPAAIAAVLWQEAPSRWLRVAARRGQRLDGATVSLLCESTLAPAREFVVQSQRGTQLDSAGVEFQCAQRLGVRTAIVELITVLGRCEGVAVVGGPEVADAHARQLVRLMSLGASVALERTVLRARLAQTERMALALGAVHDAAREIGSQHGLEDVLHAIARRACELAGTQVAFLTLVDPATGERVMGATAGMSPDVLDGQWRALDGSFGGLAVRTGLPISVRDVETDPRRVNSLPMPQLDNGLRSLLVAPMRLRERCVGLLYLGNRHITDFGAEDEILSVALGDIAAVMVENSRLYNERQRSLAQLQESSQRSVQQNDLLRRSIAVRDRLTQMVLTNHGLEAITCELARLVGNPVVVEDRFLHSLAECPPVTQRDSLSERAIATNRTPPEALADHELKGFFRRLAHARRPLSLPAIPRLGMPQTRIVASIQAGVEVLGYVSVLERDRKLDDLDFTVVEHGATILALDLMRQRTAVEVADRLRAEFLDDLVADPRGVPALAARAAHLGIDLAQTHRLLLVTPHTGSDTAAAIDRVPTSQLAQLVRQLLADRVEHLLVVDRATEVVVVLPLEAGGASGKAAACGLGRLIQECAHVRELAGDVSVAIGGECLGVDQFGRSLREATKARAIAAGLGWAPGVVCFDDLGLYRLLFQAGRPDELHAFAKDLLAPLLDHDRRQGAELVRTIETYLAHNCRVEPAARALYVHNHTLRYRLQRAEQIAGRSLGDLQWRQDLQTALAILRLQAQG